MAFNHSDHNSQLFAQFVADCTSSSFRIPGSYSPGIIIYYPGIISIKIILSSTINHNSQY